MKNKLTKVFALFASVLSICTLTACDDGSNIKTGIVTAVVTEKEYTPSYRRRVYKRWQTVPAAYHVKVEYKDCYHWFNDEKLYNAYSVDDEINVNCQVEVLDNGRILFEITDWEDEE